MTDQTADKTIRWDLFCDPTISRYDIGSPFTLSGWQYATDGRIMIRARPTSWAYDPSRKVPRAGSCFAWDHDKRDDWKPWDAAERRAPRQHWSDSDGEAWDELPDLPRPGGLLEPVRPPDQVELLSD